MFRIGCCVFFPPRAAMPLLRYAEALPDGKRRDRCFRFLAAISASRRSERV